MSPRVIVPLFGGAAVLVCVVGVPVLLRVLSSTLAESFPWSVLLALLTFPAVVATLFNLAQICRMNFIVRTDGMIVNGGFRSVWIPWEEVYRIEEGAGWHAGAVVIRFRDAARRPKVVRASAPAFSLYRGEFLARRVNGMSPPLAAAYFTHRQWLEAQPVR